MIAKKKIHLLPMNWLLSRFAAVICMLLVAILLGTSCNRDDEPPQITILEPAVGHRMDGFSTIRVKAELTDDTEIKQVLVYLANSAGSALDQTIEISPGTKTFSLDLDYQVTDNRLETGAYLLVVEASDGKNASKSFVPIGLRETPRTREGIVYTVTLGSSSLSAVRSLNADLDDLRQYFVGGSISEETAFSSFHQLFYVYNSSLVRLSAVHLGDRSPLWEERIQGRVAIMALLDESLFVRAAEGRMHGFSHFGNQFLNTEIEEIGLQPGTMLAHDGLLFSWDNVSLSSKYALNTISSSGQLLEQNQPVGYELIVSHLFGVDEQYLLLFGKEGWNKKVFWRFDRFTREFERRYTYDSSIELEDVTQIDGDRYVLADDNGLRLWNANTNSVTNLISGPGYYLSTYDPMHNELYAVDDQNTIRVYQYSDTDLVLLRQYQAEGIVSSLHIWYNK